MPKQITLATININKANPRKIEPKEFRDLVESIRRDPEIMSVNPLVLHSKTDFTILAGEQRYKALKELGYEEIPTNWVIYADGLSEQQKRKFILLDNLHAGAWDYIKLQEEFKPEELEDWNIEFAELQQLNPSELLTVGELPKEEKPRPSATADEYSVFELVMLHDNKLKLLETLNHIKSNHQLDKLEDCIMHLITLYQS